ncbi:MAG TPA: response regulator transcription factor [Polyangiaceae bacterium]|nr:response regulator transcription factor [Polyangiaceae bacterium]
MARLRVVIIDDHPVLRAGLSALIARQSDFEVVGEGGDSVSALTLVETLQPDLVLMDVSLPGPSGAEATRALRQKYPDLVVLALSVHEEIGFVNMLLEAGASGYALKRSACEELVRALRMVAAGESYLDPSLTGRLMRSKQRQASPAGLPGLRLSEREAEVARLVAQGLTMKEIAQNLNLSPRTLETYRARAMEKLHLKSRADLVRFAVSCGWFKTQ